MKKRGLFDRSGRLTVSAIVAAACVLYSSLASADTAYDLDLPAQPLADSLRALGKRTDTNILIDRRLVKDRSAPPLKAHLTADEAISTLLMGTGLGVKRIDAKTITLVSVGERAKTSNIAAEPAAQAPQIGQSGSENQTTRVAESASRARYTVAESASSASSLEEVIVTAQKRSERLQDVPVPVTSINADVLVNNNQVRLQDYYASVPGLSLTPAVNGDPQLSIRGISTGGGNPIVGITIDDVPYGSSTSIGQGGAAPDLDPSDLQRVEVLRGPQGTLYGASSMGGLIKFVTIDPSTDSVSGRLQAGTSSVQNGDKLGYNVRGGLNVPLGDTFAVRASGFTRQDPGYIDNPAHRADGVNKVDASGGSIAALWRPSDLFSAKFGVLYQSGKRDGASASYLQPGLRDLQQTALPETGTYQKDIQVYSMVLTAKLGVFDLTSVSGYNVISFHDSFDLSALFGSPVELRDHRKTDKFTQEVRLSAAINSKIDWLAGAFYTDEHSLAVQDIVAANASTGAPVGSLHLFTGPSKYREYAAFTDLTFHINDRLDLQVGARESQDKQVFSSTTVGPLVPGGESVTPDTRSKDDSFTYLVTPQFRLSPDLMIYARLASGYRPGGANADVGVPGSPLSFKPDKTQNYEIGLKGNVLDRLLSFDASLYYIDWKDIQLNIFQGGFVFATNAGKAKSQGLELSVESKPLAGLTLNAWVAWNDAKLTESFPSTSLVVGASGDRLPYSSRFSGSASATQDFPLSGSLTGFVGGAVSYVGDRTGNFQATPERLRLPSYVKTDLSTGIKYDSWSLNLYVNNVTNRRGLLTGGADDIPSYAFEFIQPRTVGLSASKTF